MVIHEEIAYARQRRRTYEETLIEKVRGDYKETFDEEESPRRVRVGNATGDIRTLGEAPSSHSDNRGEIGFTLGMCYTFLGSLKNVGGGGPRPKDDVRRDSS